jgi:hypothetical protein
LLLESFQVVKDLAGYFVKRRRTAGADEVEHRSQGLSITTHLNSGIKDPDGRIDSDENTARNEISERIGKLKTIRSAIESGQAEVARKYAERIGIRDVTIEGIDREIRDAAAVRKVYHRAEPTDVHRDRTAIEHKKDRAVEILNKKCKALAAHIEAAVRTGTSCIYEPNRDPVRPNIKWNLPSPDSIATPADSSNGPTQSGVPKNAPRIRPGPRGVAH